jgi:hypothetical protein
MTKNCSLCKWETTIVAEGPGSAKKYYTMYVCDNPNCGFVQTFATPLKIGGIS